MINIPTGVIGYGSNTNQSGSSGQIGHANPAVNPTGATGNGSNTDQSSSIDNNNTNTASNGQASNGPTAIGSTGHGNNTDQSGQAITINKPVENPTGATGNSSNTDQSDAIDNGPVANNPTGAIGKQAEANKGITDLYMSDGDNYYIDDNALSNAQMKIGDDKKAASVVGSGDSSKANSNINTGVFGGSSRAAHPGYSLW